MPIYEYHCRDCDGQFEVLVRTATSDRRPECPDCGSAEVRRLLSLVTVRSGRPSTGATTTASDWTSSSGGCGCGSCGCGH